MKGLTFSQVRRLHFPPASRLRRATEDDIETLCSILSFALVDRSDAREVGGESGSPFLLSRTWRFLWRVVNADRPCSISFINTSSDGKPKTGRRVRFSWRRT